MADFMVFAIRMYVTCLHLWSRPPRSQQAPQTVTEPWHLRLAEVCNKALVSHHLEKAVEVAVAFGVAVPEELSEVADEICNQAVMKPLEPKRFLVLLRPE